MVSEPNDPNSPDAVISEPTAEDTSITLSALGEYVLQLDAFDGEYTCSDTVTINVYNSNCEAAQSLPDYVPLVGDLNRDCRVDEADMLLLLESGNRIGVAERHYFLAESGDWVAVQNLKTATKLQTPKGSIGIVNVTKRPMPYVGKVYNLKVEGSDRYLVGKDAVIVRDY